MPSAVPGAFGVPLYATVVVTVVSLKFVEVMGTLAYRT